MTSTWNSTSSNRNPRFIDADPYSIESTAAVNSEPQPQQGSTSSGSSSTSTIYDESYVEEVRTRFLMQQSARRNVQSKQKTLGSDEHLIVQRLREHHHPCDLSSLTCLTGYCGRSFERLPVLAFHISYAHQDVMTADSAHLTCLVCGKKWTTVRRKIMHLSLAHREIGEEHNRQCMLQVEQVIAPNAPKAIRLERKARMGRQRQHEMQQHEEDVDDDVDEDVTHYEYIGTEVDAYNY